MRILGISAFYHDSAAALIEDGRIVAAAQEERFTRRKHDSGFPASAVRYCARRVAGANDAIDYVVFYEKPFLKFERLLETYLAFAPRGFRSFRKALPLWTREKLFQRRILTRELAACGVHLPSPERLLFSEHHQSHAASAFFPSPFEHALILTLDAVGEWATTSVAIGDGNAVRLLKEIHFPHSLGLLYSAFTYHAGFRVNSGEYKLMGLAPYGEPRYARAILDQVLDLKCDGSFRLNLDYFDYCTGLRMTNRRFDAFFGGPPRAPDAPLTQREMDLAASAQSVIEEAVLCMTRTLATETGERNLCLAGGVALNCVANSRILRDGRFDRVWVQPAAGDAGGAVGAALAAYHVHLRKARVAQAEDGMSGALLGPEYEEDEIEHELLRLGAHFVVLREEAMLRACVEILTAGEVLGWFQGPMEFGPRALGARSILADARIPGMRDVLNAKVKRRESFRPFAPSVLCEYATEWFEVDCPTPYMQFVAPVRATKRDAVPSVTHIDGTARVQTVDARANPRFRALLETFHNATGCPILLNTSFNVRGEPIVCTPEDAFRCFMGTNIEALAIGDCFLTRSSQDANLLRSHVPVDDAD